MIDLLPDREPATVEAWLRRNPQVEVVARDRNGGYGGAVTRALPDAIQVADRWHLLENAGVAFLTAVRTAMPEIRKALGTGEIDPTRWSRRDRAVLYACPAALPAQSGMTERSGQRIEASIEINH